MIKKNDLGFEKGQVWEMKPVCLEEGFWGGQISKDWGRSPQYFLKSPPDSKHKTPRFHCPALALFHSLDIDTKPYSLELFWPQSWPVPSLNCV